MTACLRDIDATTLTQAIYSQPGAFFGLPPVGPVLEEKTLPYDPYALFAAGEGNEVPIMTGSNADEAVMFTGAIMVGTREALQQQIAAIVGFPSAPAVMDLYPESDFPNPKNAYDAFISDIEIGRAHV